MVVIPILRKENQSRGEASDNGATKVREEDRWRSKEGKAGWRCSCFKPHLILLGSTLHFSFLVGCKYYSSAVSCSWVECTREEKYNRSNSFCRKADTVSEWHCRFLQRSHQHQSSEELMCLASDAESGNNLQRSVQCPYTIVSADYLIWSLFTKYK